MLLIFSQYLIHHKIEVHAVHVFKMFNTWFLNECILKWKFLKQSFCFIFIPKTHFYIIYTSFLKHAKMFNLGDIKNENNEDHNKKWPYFPGHSYRMLKIGGSGSEKTMHCLI